MKASAAAAAGVGGGTTEMLNSTFRRAVAFSEQSQKEKVDYATGDMRLQRSNQISNAVASMDQGTTFAERQSVILADKSVSPFPYLVQGIAGAVGYIDTYLQARKAAATTTTTQAASSATTAGTGAVIAGTK